jgi:HEAT repeat protein
LIGALREADLRETAWKSLASMGGAVVDPLVQVLHDDYDKYVRLAAARALAEIDDPGAARALTEILFEPNTEFIAAVYRFLIRQGRPGTEVQLTAALRMYGRHEMAEDFVASGSVLLKTAAENWAAENGVLLGLRTSELPEVHWASANPNR